VLWVKCFRDGGALLMREQYGDSLAAVRLPDADEEALAGLHDTPKASAAMARLFVAGAMAGERAVRTAMPTAG
jgi:hypothetical protein